MIHPKFSREIDLSDIDHAIDHKVDIFLRIKDPTIRSLYDKFILSRPLSSSFLLISLSLTAITFLYLAWTILNYFTEEFAVYETVNNSILLLCCVVFLVLLWSFYFMVVVVRGGRSVLSSHRITATFFLASHLFISYHHLVRVVKGDCNESGHWYFHLHCDPFAEAHGLPMESTLLVMAMPFIHAISSQGMQFTWSLILWFISLALLVFSICYLKATESIFLVLLYFVGSPTFLLAIKRQSYLIFFMKMKMDAILQESKKEAEEENAQELRHMIANVAHDLKTPLTSFLSGMECVAQVVQDLRCKPQGSFDLQDAMVTITNCLSNMRNTNSFMLMTINRCIDYTKASKGMPLIPKYETVDVEEALSLPMNCMKDIQQRVSIVLLPLPGELCTHIVTDKQWLQENVLCLVSNGVKYSAEGGVVTIAASLITASLPVENRPVKEGKKTLRVLCDEEKLLHIEVEDAGEGLTEEAMSTLFSPARQAQRLAGGTGLGLYCLAQRVQALGGNCGVQRRRDGGQGALFWFDIPYSPDSVAAASSSSSARNASLRRSSSLKIKLLLHRSISDKSKTIPNSCCSLSEDEPVVERLRMAPHLEVEKNDSLNSWRNHPGMLNILIVDDSPMILKMTSLMLRRHRHAVTTASNGAEAVRMVTEQMADHDRGYDVIIMDMQMPVMDGIEAAQRIRKKELTGSWFVGTISPKGGNTVADPPLAKAKQIIIGVSANSDGETAQAAKRAGIDGFLPKPFTVDAFYKAYRDALEELANPPIPF